MNTNLSDAFAGYKICSTINQDHKVYLVENAHNGNFYVGKILDYYNENVYSFLYNNPIQGTPSIFDVKSFENKLVVIEEYISGTSLATLIENCQLNATLIREYVIQLCDTLAELHSQNPPIIHRDIKPSNIIINHRNQAILLDFNAAKNYSDSKNEDTVRLGTEEYAAPEQFGFGASSPQTDIFCLGRTLKEMVESLPHKTQVFEPIIEKCTELSPQYRYEDVKALKKALLNLDLTHVKYHFNKKITPPQIVKKPVEEKHGLSFFLPPGFRSGKLWKMILVMSYYIISIAASLGVEPLYSHPVVAITHRLYIFYFLISMLLIPCNYLNVQRLMPLCKSKHQAVRIIGIVLLWLIIFVVVSFIFEAIVTAFKN